MLELIGGNLSVIGKFQRDLAHGSRVSGLSCRWSTRFGPLVMVLAHALLRKLHRFSRLTRIRSMADAHPLLSTGRWRGVNLAHLVRQELAPCAAAPNTVVEGPAIVLAADAAQPVAFVLHELVTNAAKYGALSVPKGHVSVQWHQRACGHVPGALVLDWKETGGPLVPTSISPGYGTSVIKDLIPYELGGVVDLVFAAKGWVRNEVDTLPWSSNAVAAVC
jgi:two-component sensor histidine kinase